MRHLEAFNFFKKKEKYPEVVKLCIKYDIHGYKINDDGSVDVDDSVELICKNQTEIPIKFNKVTGYFSCRENNLITLRNSPKIILGNNFFCYSNNLKDVYGLNEFFKGDLFIYVEDYKTYNPSEVIVKEKNNPVCEILYLVNKGWFKSHLHQDNDENSYTKKKLLNRKGHIIALSMKQLKFAKFLNIYEVIRNGNTVIESRLEDYLYEVGINELPENLEFKNYKLI